MIFFVNLVFNTTMLFFTTEQPTSDFDFIRDQKSKSGFCTWQRCQRFGDRHQPAIVVLPTQLLLLLLTVYPFKSNFLRPLQPGVGLVGRGGGGARK